MRETMQVSVDEIAALLGQKDIEILVLQKQVGAMQKRIEELTPNPEEKTELQSVR